MPAPSVFLNSADIAAVLGCSRRTAQNMLAMFTQQGKTIRSGMTSHGTLVSLKNFAAYLCEQDGEDPIERRREIKECLQENKMGHTRKDLKKEA